MENKGHNRGEGKDWSMWPLGCRQQKTKYSDWIVIGHNLKVSVHHFIQNAKCLSGKIRI